MADNGYKAGAGCIPREVRRIAPNVLLPGDTGKENGKDPLRQK